MNPTDVLLSIAIVGIYTQIYIYLKTNYKKQTDMIKIFSLTLHPHHIVDCKIKYDFH